MSLSRFLHMIPDAMDVAIDSDTADTELHDLVKCVAISVLEHDSVTFLQGASEYYDRIAADITNDPETLAMFEALVHRLRHRYASMLEHSKYVYSLPLTRQTPICSDICCCCHEPLDSWRRVVRLKAASGTPSECGHLIHHGCAKRLKPDDSGHLSCPMCRSDLGRSLVFWYDLAGKQPAF